MPDMADRAAIAGVAVVVGVNCDRGSGLKAREAHQQKQYQGGSQPASEDAIWIGRVQTDSLSILDGSARRRFHRTASISERVLRSPASLSPEQIDDSRPGERVG